MTAETCMFNKFGFCKNGDSCRKKHLVEICLKDACDARKCDKSTQDLVDSSTKKVSVGLRSTTNLVISQTKQFRNKIQKLNLL